MKLMRASAAGLPGRYLKNWPFWAKEHQIICITHLPQIAAMADQHFKIEKPKGRVRPEQILLFLDEPESTKELARLFGSDLLTDAAVSNAKMKELARDTKTILK